MSGQEQAAPAGNSAQIEYWNSRVGEIWVRNQQRLDRAFAPFTHSLLDRAGPANGDSCIDIGCGCGELALALAAKTGPRGRVMGIDISKPMLARADERAHGLHGEHAKLIWREADAAVHAFVPEYDLLASRFGVMFFADPVAAFGNLRTALKAGGRCAFLCWAPLAQNPWCSVPLAALRPLVEPPPVTDPHAPGPFAFAEVAHVEAIMRAAGFVDFRAESLEAPMLLGQAERGSSSPHASAIDDALELALRTGPAAALLRDADEATRRAARPLVGAALAPFCADDEVRLQGTAWLYTGRNPT